MPVRVLGTLFRRLFLARLIALNDAGRLGFFGSLAPLADRRIFVRHLSPVRPEAALAYLSRYTHRVAISNRRLLAFDETGVTFRYKDYRRDGADRQQVMTLGTDEFVRRFLLHVLPRGFHRIATTACSPVRRARPASHVHARCWRSRHRSITTCRKSRSMPVCRAHAAVDT
jgi:hypothetical protein